MRILITNNHLQVLGGTETWVLTMAKELAKQHDVRVFTPNSGYVAELLADYMDYQPKNYDLALINHYTTIDVDAKYKIFTSHGTEPDLERPKAGCDVYIAVNENVAEKYGLDKIIKNPIDTVLFSPKTSLREAPERILNLTTIDIPFTHTKPSRTAYNMPELMNQHDLVVSMGRGALEAMSCGRNVIVWDRKIGWNARGDGYMDDTTRIRGYVAGEYNKTTINWQEEVAKYRKEHGEQNRAYILKHHNVVDIAKEYLSL